MSTADNPNPQARKLAEQLERSREWMKSKRPVSARQGAPSVDDLRAHYSEFGLQFTPKQQAAE